MFCALSTKYLRQRWTFRPAVLSAQASTRQLISITRIRRRQRSKAELQLTKCSAIDDIFPVETVSNFPRENVSPRVILIRFDLMRLAAGGSSSSTVVSLEFSNFHIDTFGDLL